MHRGNLTHGEGFSVKDALRADQGIQFCNHDISLEESIVPCSKYIYLASACKLRNLFDMKVTLSQNMHKVQLEALLKSGAYLCFVHYCFAQKHNLVLCKLKNEVQVFNTDATENCKGRITHYTHCLMHIGNHLSWQSFLITDIGW